MVIKNKYLSTSEAGELLGISRVAVLKRIKKGQLQAERVGRNYAIAREELLGEIGEQLKEVDQKNIDVVVKRVVEEYGEVLIKLGAT